MNPLDQAKLICSVIVMLAAIIVPYTGTCIFGLFFVCVLYFSEMADKVTECIIRIENDINKD